MEGHVAALCAGQDPSFVKPRRQRIELVAGAGIAGDRHFGRDPRRSILLVDTRTYGYLAEHGLDLPYGSLGENVVVAGDALRHAEPGTVLRLGQTAVVRITEVRRRCRRLMEAHPRLLRLLARHQGMFYAEVLEGGTVEENDTVGPVASPATV